MSLLALDYLKSSQSEFIEQLYQSYLKDPESIDASWKAFFDGIELGHAEGFNEGAAEVEAQLANGALNGGNLNTSELIQELSVARFIETYRRLGHLQAAVNPLKTPAALPQLELSRFGLSTADMEKTFYAGSLITGAPQTLSQIIAVLQRAYCGKTSVEYDHLISASEQEFIRKKFEGGEIHAAPSPDARRFILKRLTATESFERFLHTRFVAQKRFSVEGGDNVIPMLDSIIENGANLGSNEFIIGMAHRGRLNVLTQIMGKKAQWIFTEFEGNYTLDADEGEGDVKYHKGWITETTSLGGKKVRLSLSPNPSHLEFVNPVIEGMARARQDITQDRMREQVCPIAIHGDAAFAGQGVCYETTQMSLLPAYKTGGTVHIVINNQVGFTTSPKDARSSPYSTDLGRVLDSPILHVNGDDADACWMAARFAIEYRNRFKKDVFLDLICYRKYGHNEGDEPAFTQPQLYSLIKNHPSPREVYAGVLAQQGVVSADESTALVTAQMNAYQEDLTRARATGERGHPPYFSGEWAGMKSGDEKDVHAPISTRVPAEKIKHLNQVINTIPSSFHLHSKLGRFFEARAKTVQEEKGIDWGAGEALAYATLAAEGHPVRISGQDAERGTFTHRHAVLTDTETGEKYCPLAQMGADQKAPFEVYNSHLSETAVLGFEFGYSTEHPKALTIWEAQFGDFANGAQVIIDQFIASAETKWHKFSGLTLLLPHGYEGQGPEHSSARLERFLLLCGRSNMIVGNVTTPAQIFHILRRQVKRDFRKPLIIMSPKSMLRHPMAISELKDFTDHDFREVLDDPNIIDAKKITRVILCSGKVYYDLAQTRNDLKLGDVAIVRLEQIYPFPEKMLETVLNHYSNAKTLIWAQEESRNMGAWQFVAGQFNGALSNFGERIQRTIAYAGREVSASPAVGAPKIHEKQMKEFLKAAFGA